MFVFLLRVLILKAKKQLFPPCKPLILIWTQVVVIFYFIFICLCYKYLCCSAHPPPPPPPVYCTYAAIVIDVCRR